MKRLIYIGIPVLLLFGLLAWRYGQNATAKRQQAQAASARKNAPPEVRVAPAVVRDIVHSFSGIASVTAPQNVPVAPKVTGLVTYLQVREGTPVHRGEVLARLDPREIQASVNQQESAVAEARYRLSQAVLTTGPNSASVEAQINQQIASLASAQANLNQTVQNYDLQVAAAQSAVNDAQERVDAANSAITNATANVESAKANLADAQVRYGREYSLYKQGFLDAQDVDDAKTQAAVETTAVKAANAQVASDVSTRNSAVAELRAAEDQSGIVQRTGKANIQAARSVAAQAQAALNYARSNRAQVPAYQANIDALRADLQANEHQLRNLQYQLGDTILTSPADGYVTSRYVDPGAVVGAGQAVVAVQTMHQLFVSTTAPEGTGGIREGDPAVAMFDAIPGRTFSGMVAHVDAAGDPNSHEFLILATMNNSRDIIRPGMYGKLTITTFVTHHAVVVPREAVKNGPNGQTVTIIDSNSIAHVVPVKTGDSDVVGIQITQGIRAGQQVMVLSYAPVKDGQKVKVDNAGAPYNLAGQPTVIAGGNGPGEVPATMSTGTGAAPTYATQTPTMAGSTPSLPTVGTGLSVISSSPGAALTAPSTGAALPTTTVPAGSIPSYTAAAPPSTATAITGTGVTPTSPQAFSGGLAGSAAAGAIPAGATVAAGAAGAGSASSGPAIAGGASALGATAR